MHSLLPIVFIHTGTADYMPYALWQARQRGGRDAQVVLLGDRSNHHLNGLARHFLLKNFWNRAGELEKVFVNHSSNGREFELICLQRWLALAEWMEAEGHQQCVYLDTDVLLFSEVKPLIHKWRNFGMTMAGISGHTNLVSKREVLEDFGRYVLDTYKSIEGKLWLERTFKEEYTDLGVAGGVSDMTFLTKYRADHQELVANLSEPGDDNTVFDITMDYTEYFEAENGFKKIHFENLTPFGIYKPTHTQVRFHTLHFQGKAKPLVPRYVTQSLGLHYWVRLNQVFSLINKAKARFFTF